ncbi:FtsK/SpoIIIE domain-containing protein [Arthrobacter sp. NPDC080031]|uniref:FtsK/SpoIIIE domain-containing protein n=1 Tax=Arthrobacter sp. NPDC080031 TaxID=3155918 RepID=UPI00344E9355
MQGEREIKLRFSIPGKSGAAHADFIVKFGPESTVRDLTDGLEAQGIVGPGDYILRRELVRYGDARGVQTAVHGYLDHATPVDVHDLIDGDVLEIVADAGQLPMPLRGRGSDLKADEIYVVDEAGTRKGRVTLLCEGDPVVFSALDSDAQVVVDDGQFGRERMVIQRRGNAAEVTFSDGLMPRMLVGGERPSSSIVRLTPGVRLAFTDLNDEVDPVRAEWVIASGASLIGKAPLGKVRLEPKARTTVPKTPTLRERYRKISRRPEKPRNPDFQFENLVTPIGVGAILFAVTDKPLSLILAAPLAVPMIVSYRRNLRHQERVYQKNLDVWLEQSRKSLSEQTRLTGQEEDILRELGPDSEWLKAQTYRRRASTWGRSHRDRSFMHVVVGNGSFRSHQTIELEAGVELDEIELESVLKDGKRTREGDHLASWVADDTPVLVDLKSHNLAIVGPAQSVKNSTIDVLLQLVCSHSPTELAIATFIPEGELGSSYDWMKWLPQVTAPSIFLPLNRMVLGRTSSTVFLREVLKVLKSREDLLRREVTARHHVLFILHESAEVDVALLEEILSLTPGLFHVLWIGSSRDGIPQFIDAFLEIPADHALSLAGQPEPRASLTLPSATIDDFEPVQHTHSPDRTALSLAPLYDPRASGASASIPPSVRASTVWNIEAVHWEIANEDGDIVSRSASKELVARLGRASTDKDLVIDLVEDGPHMLIGGTTGSGKSEFLRSFVLGLTLEYNPDEVSLFLVDYKGGQTFRKVAKVPHTIGFISDLEGANIDRAIKFLQAEIRRRLSAFLEAGDAKEFEEYRANIATRPGAKQLPRLVVVFDEFHTLVRETEGKRGADYSVLEAVEDIAQRGRSLGIHVILATQRPSTKVIRDDTRANIRAKVALATLSDEDSRVIIDAPDAAQIPRSLPGRALLSTGGSSLVEFQSPIVSREYNAPGRAGGKRVTLAPLRAGTSSQGLSTDPDATGKPTSGPTEIDHVVKTIRDSYQEAHPLQISGSGEASFQELRDVAVLPASLFEEPRRINPDVRRSGERIAGQSSSDGSIVIGAVDDPANQCIQSLDVDMEAGMFVLQGPPRTGKTHGLLLLAEGWLAKYPAGEVFVLDAQTELTKLAEFRKHTNWYVTSIGDAASLTRVIDQLWSAGETPGDDPVSPRLLIIDGFDRLQMLFESNQRTGLWLERLIDLTRYGRAAGIHMAISIGSEQPDKVFQSDIGVTLRLGRNFYEHRVPRSEWLPGYGLNDQDQLIQLYFLDEESTPVLSKSSKFKPWLQPSLSELAYPGWENNNSIGLGRDDILGEIESIDLTKHTLLISGRARSGRTNVLRVIAAQLYERTSKRVILCGKQIEGESAYFLTEPLQYEAPSGASSIEHEQLQEAENWLAASYPEAACINGRPVFLFDEEDTYGDDTIRERLKLLHRYRRIIFVCTIKSSSQPDRSTVAGFDSVRAQSIHLYLAPNPRLVVAENSSLYSEPLVHRPRSKYLPGQGILVDESGQRFVWVPHARSERNES